MGAAGAISSTRLSASCEAPLVEGGVINTASRVIFFLLRGISCAVGSQGNAELAQVVRKLILAAIDINAGLQKIPA
jgi:hypothetical protein